VIGIVADLVIERVRNHESPFYIPVPEGGEFRLEDNDTEAVDRLLAENDDARHRLLAAIVARSPQGSDLWYLGDSTPPVARKQDFGWFLEQASTGGPELSRSWAELAQLVFDRTDSAHIELWLDARKTSEVVAEVIDDPVLVEIKSREGRKMKAQHLCAERRRLRPERASRSGSRASPAQEVEDRLRFCESDKPLGIGGLWNVLTRDEPSEQPTYRPKDPTAMPGWERAEARTRERILAVAIRLLTKLPERPASPPREFGAIDAWGYAVARAAYLLARERPEALSAVSAETWTGCCDVIIRFLAFSYSRDKSAEAWLCDVLNERAPTQTRAEILRAIRSTGSADGPPFIIEVWDSRLDARLGDELAKMLGEEELPPATYAAVLGWLARARHTSVSTFIDALFDGQPPADGPDRERAIHVASQLLADKPQRFWPLIWKRMSADTDWGRAVIEHACHRERFALLTALAPDDLVDLAIRIFREYSPESDPSYDGGHSVSPDDDVRDLRRYVINQLGSTGRADGLLRLRDAFPQYPWLADSVIDAANVRRRETWCPPSACEILALASRNESRFVSSPDELLDVILESLDRLEQKLHGTTPAVEDLWNREGSSPRTPKDEESFSDYVARHLKDDLRARRVVVNREVQIRRRQESREAGGAPGQKPDIVVQAVPNDSAGTSGGVFEVIIEVKGCWHGEVRTALASQLVERYLRDNSCRHGLYLVGWFRCEGWDGNDSRRERDPWSTLDESRRELDGQARVVCTRPDGLLVRARVLDCSLRLGKP